MGRLYLKGKATLIGLNYEQKPIDVNSSWHTQAPSAGGQQKAVPPYSGPSILPCVRTTFGPLRFGFQWIDETKLGCAA